MRPPQDTNTAAIPKAKVFRFTIQRTVHFFSSICSECIPCWSPCRDLTVLYSGWDKICVLYFVHASPVLLIINSWVMGYKWNENSKNLYQDKAEFLWMHKDNDLTKDNKWRPFFKLSFTCTVQGLGSAICTSFCWICSYIVVKFLKDLEQVNKACQKTKPYQIKADQTNRFEPNQTDTHAPHPIWLDSTLCWYFLTIYGG